MSSIEPLLRIDEKLSQLQLPKLVEIKKLDLENDISLIVCAGFEDRASEILKMVSKEQPSNPQVVCVDYLPEYKENQCDQINKICGGSGLKVQHVKYDRMNPSGIGDKLIHVLQKENRIYIDISGMSRLLIVQLLVSLAKRPTGLDKVTILYTEADFYPPSCEEFEKNTCGSTSGEYDSYISTGVYEVAIAPELSSVSMQGQPIRLVVFPAFNREQLPALIQEVQPAFVNLIQGTPPKDENSWRLDAIDHVNQKIIHTLTNLDKVRLSTLNYEETLDYLTNLYGQRSSFDRIIISPTGSKMQAVAVGIFKSFMDDVQIVYPTPQEFTEPDCHTEGVKQIYRLDLDVFSNLLDYS